MCHSTLNILSGDKVTVAQCTWDPGRISENNHAFILHEFTPLILQLHQLICIPNTVW